jgi:hypothetical protein
MWNILNILFLLQERLKSLEEEITLKGFWKKKWTLLEHLLTKEQVRPEKILGPRYLPRFFLTVPTPSVPQNLPIMESHYSICKRIMENFLKNIFQEIHYSPIFGREIG